MVGKNQLNIFMLLIVRKSFDYVLSSLLGYSITYILFVVPMQAPDYKATTYCYSNALKEIITCCLFLYRTFLGWVHTTQNILAQLFCKNDSWNNVLFLSLFPFILKRCAKQAKNKISKLPMGNFISSRSN